METAARERRFKQPRMSSFSGAIARPGHGRLVLITGDPGIGKTRLCDELSRQAEARGTPVLWGHCWEGGGAPPFWPWVQALRGYARECDPLRLATQLGDGAADVAQIVPEVAARLPNVVPATASRVDDTRFRAFDSITEFLARAGADHPLVIVLDDLQAADESSLLLLRFIARSLRAMRVLLVATRRRHAANTVLPLLSEIGREGDALSPRSATSFSEVWKFVFEGLRFSAIGVHRRLSAVSSHQGQHLKAW